MTVIAATTCVDERGDLAADLARSCPVGTAPAAGRGGLPQYRGDLVAAMTVSMVQIPLRPHGMERGGNLK